MMMSGDSLTPQVQREASELDMHTSNKKFRERNDEIEFEIEK